MHLRPVTKERNIASQGEVFGEWAEWNVVGRMYRRDIDPLTGSVPDIHLDDAYHIAIVIGDGAVNHGGITIDRNRAAPLIDFASMRRLIRLVGGLNREFRSKRSRQQQHRTAKASVHYGTSNSVERVEQYDRHPASTSFHSSLPSHVSLSRLWVGSFFCFGCLFRWSVFCCAWLLFGLV